MTDHDFDLPIRGSGMLAQLQGLSGGASAAGESPQAVLLVRRRGSRYHSCHEAPRVRRDDHPELPDRAAESGSDPGGRAASDGPLVGPPGGVRVGRAELLLEECAAGDPDAAAARLAAVADLPVLEQGPDAAALAEALVRDVPLPPNAVADATHIALAAVHGIDLLVTWNCRHIANPVLRPRVEAVCRAAGYEPPVICTPGELLGGVDDA